MAQELSIEAAAEPTDELVGTMKRLLPHLSSATPPDRAKLGEIVRSEATTLLVARLGEEIVGMLSLAEFPLPSGRRAWIEDVVTDPDRRGQGIASALVNEAVRRATAAGCRTVDLTSRPEREEANRLYERLGFAHRETNVYRKVLD